MYPFRNILQEIDLPLLRPREDFGLASAHPLASVGAVVAIPLTWCWKLETGAGLDLTPSMHESAFVTVQTISCDQGLMLVTVEYCIRQRRGAPSGIGAL